MKTNSFTPLAGTYEYTPSSCNHPFYHNSLKMNAPTPPLTLGNASLAEAQANLRAHCKQLDNLRSTLLSCGSKLCTINTEYKLITGCDHSVTSVHSGHNAFVNPDPEMLACFNVRTRLVAPQWDDRNNIEDNACSDH